MSRYKVERSADARRDLRSIFNFLIRSHMQFGEGFEDARERAGRRMMAIDAAMRDLGEVPHKGTRRDYLAVGLRSVTKDRTIFYFVVDDANKVVRIAAVFFGGEDHHSLMLRRLMRKR